jgi:hypothetical protein
MNVAVRRCQHSLRFGHLALEHTVFKRNPVRIELTSSRACPLFTFTLIHGGSFGRCGVPVQSISINPEKAGH